MQRDSSVEVFFENPESEELHRERELGRMDAILNRGGVTGNSCASELVSDVEDMSDALVPVGLTTPTPKAARSPVDKWGLLKVASSAILIEDAPYEETVLVQQPLFSVEQDPDPLVPATEFANAASDLGKIVHWARALLKSDAVSEDPVADVIREHSKAMQTIDLTFDPVVIVVSDAEDSDPSYSSSDASSCGDIDCDMCHASDGTCRSRDSPDTPASSDREFVVSPDASIPEEPWETDPGCKSCGGICGEHEEDCDQVVVDLTASDDESDHSFHLKDHLADLKAMVGLEANDSADEEALEEFRANLSEDLRRADSPGAKSHVTEYWEHGVDLDLKRVKVYADGRPAVFEELAGSKRKRGH
jgi:hypothetical protein